MAPFEGDDDLPLDTGAHGLGVGREGALERRPVEAAHGAHVGVSKPRQLAPFVIGEAGAEARPPVGQRHHAPAVGADAERREVAEAGIGRAQCQTALEIEAADGGLAGVFGVEGEWSQLRHAPPRRAPRWHRWHTTRRQRDEGIGGSRPAWPTLVSVPAQSWHHPAGGGHTGLLQVFWPTSGSMEYAKDFDGVSAYAIGDDKRCPRDHQFPCAGYPARPPEGWMAAQPLHGVTHVADHSGGGSRIVLGDVSGGLVEIAEGGADPPNPHRPTSLMSGLPPRWRRSHRRRPP